MFKVETTQTGSGDKPVEPREFTTHVDRAMRTAFEMGTKFGNPRHKGHSFLSLTSGSPMSPEGFGGSPWYFDYPIRRCVTCVMPHMICIVSVPTI